MHSRNAELISSALDARHAILDALDNLYGAINEEVAELEEARLSFVNQQCRPVHLPFEILAFIFELACIARVSSQPFDHETCREKLYESRGSINLTCRRWRDVALRTSAIWSTVFIHYSEETCLCSSGARRIPREVRGRALQRPLSLRLGSESQIGSEAAVALASHHLRICEVVELEIVDVTPLYSMLSTKYQPTFLRFLALNITNPDSPYTGELTLPFIPTLRDLLLSYRAPVSYLSLRLPELCNVTRLHLEGDIDTTNAISLINSCHSLEWLVWIIDIRFLGLSLPRLSPLPSLRGLFVQSGGLRMLHKFEAPNLERLALHDENHNDTPSAWPSNSYPLSDPNQFPRLRFITMNAYMRQDTVERFLQSHSYLEEIVLGGDAFSLDLPFARALASETPSGPCLPHLRRLHAYCYWENNLIELDGARELLRMHAQNERFELLLANEEAEYSPAGELKAMYAAAPVKFDFRYFRGEDEEMWKWGRHFGLD